MYILKKIISQFFFPVPLTIYILLAGLILLWFSKKQKTGKILVSIAVFVLLIVSATDIGKFMIGRLEKQYKPYDTQNPAEKLAMYKDTPSKLIVVLAGGHTSDKRLPMASRLNYQSLVRLVEAARLHRLIPGSKLLLSGGTGGFDPVPNAKVMADVAASIGVEQENIVLETTSNDTKDQADLIKTIVGEDPFILVTSASHMPRAMGLFKKIGMKPIPAPVGHTVKKSKGMHPGSFFPSSGRISALEAAVYEYMGLVWTKLRGQT